MYKMVRAGVAVALLGTGCAAGEGPAPTTSETGGSGTGQPEGGAGGARSDDDTAGVGGSSAGDGAVGVDGGGAGGASGTGSQGGVGVSGGETGASGAGAIGGERGEGGAGATGGEGASGGEGDAGGQAGTGGEPDPGDIVTGKADSDPPYRSGQRLRAHVLDGGGSSAVFLDWNDNGERCQFLQAVDGVTRCLPSLAASRVTFHDADCTVPILNVRRNQPAPQYAAVPVGLSCNPSEWRVRRVGQIAATDGSYDLNAAGVCEFVVPRVGGSLQVDSYLLEEDVELTQFVAAELVIGENSGRLRPMTVLAEDGSFERIGIWDNERNEQCWPVPNTNGVCAPTLATADAFADPNCTWPVSSARLDPRFPDSCAEPSVGMIATRSDYCQHDETHYFAVGGQLTQNSSWRNLDTCSAAGSLEGATLFLGELPPDGLARARRIWVGDGRFNVSARIGPDGARVDAAVGAEMFDVAAEINCDRGTICDGSIRCEPPRFGWAFQQSCGVDPVSVLPTCRSVPKMLSSRLPTAQPGPFGTPAPCWDGSLFAVGSEVALETTHEWLVEYCVAFTRPTPGLLRGFAVEPAQLDAIPLVERVE